MPIRRGPGGDAQLGRGLVAGRSRHPAPIEARAGDGRHPPPLSPRGPIRPDRDLAAIGRRRDRTNPDARQADVLGSRPPAMAPAAPRYCAIMGESLRRVIAGNGGCPLEERASPVAGVSSTPRRPHPEVIGALGRIDHRGRRRFRPPEGPPGPQAFEDRLREKGRGREPCDAWSYRKCLVCPEEAPGLGRGRGPPGRRASVGDAGQRPRDRHPGSRAGQCIGRAIEVAGRGEVMTIGLADCLPIAPEA